MTIDFTEKPELKTSMLAYRRSLEVSEAMMNAGNWEGRTPALDENGISNHVEKGLVPVQVVEKGVRGQTSNETSKVNKENWGKSNPQIVDFAMMPVETDMLVISFSLTAIPESLKPSASDNKYVSQNLAAFADRCVENGSYIELAWRYLGNIANGRISWRNGAIAHETEVVVQFENSAIVFDPSALSWARVPSREEIRASAKEGAEHLDALVELLVEGMTTRARPIMVAWRGKMSALAEVYPSQEYKGTAARKEVSRSLSAIERTIGGNTIRCATLHGQKIGAAIRCIDDWHNAPNYEGIPVPVNPYAGVQEAGIALRVKATGVPGFYDLRKKPDSLIAELDASEPSGNVLFFLANLVRGGVYGSKGDQA